MNGVRVLVISNNCFSKTDSNGRTLAKYFTSCFAPNELAQIFINGIPDGLICSNYYQVSDRNAFHSLVERKEFGHEVETVCTPLTEEAHRTTLRSFRKTPFTLLMREFAWRHGKWYGSRLKKWIADFQPTHLFLFLADNAFLIHFAMQLSIELHIPIVAYTTEDYYFKNYNYLTKRFSPLYFLLHIKINRAYRLIQNNISLCVLNTPMLTKKFAGEFSFPCECLFAQSDIDFISHVQLPEDGQWWLSYLGNLGLNRHKALMEVADTLNELLPGTKLHVYGNIPDTVKAEFLADTNIHYEGFINYEQVTEIIHKSHLLIHVEYNDAYNCKDLRFAFSTKIADSISSGTPLLMYGNSQLAETVFLNENNCAFVADSVKRLKPVLSSALFNADARKKVVANAKHMRDQYFCVGDRQTIRSLILSLYDDANSKEFQ